MLKLNEIVIVEGKYDKIRLSSIIDAVIIETNGFSIFGDKEKLSLLKRLSIERGLIIITDSDKAGFKIRNYLCGSIDNAHIKNVYIPDVFGKEKRKHLPSKEGKLGVEGLEANILLLAFQKAGVIAGESTISSGKQITKADLYEDGLCGTENSLLLRHKLSEKLDLPKGLSTNRLIEILNIMLTFNEYKEMIKSEKIH